MPLILIICSNNMILIIIYLILEINLLVLFLTNNILVFYILFEFSVLPLYYLIGKIGSENKFIRIFTTTKFFLYTIIFSILFFISIIYLKLFYNTLIWEFLILNYNNSYYSSMFIYFSILLRFTL